MVKIIKNPGNGLLNNLNDPVLNVLRRNHTNFMSSHHSCSILYKPMVTNLYDVDGVTEWFIPGTP
jgi:hypothetical protein